MAFRVVILASVAISLALPASAQVPDSAAALQLFAEELQTGSIDPELIRARIEAAGLTVDEVREQLRLAGYPEHLLDQYLGVDAVGPATGGLTPAQLENVLRRLSVPPLDPAISDSIRAASDSGRRAVEDLLVDSLAEVLELPIFGKSLFDAITTQFLPVTMGPVPGNYLLGPGDELVLILTGDVQEVYTLPVTREGFLVIPNVGRVSVNGLTLDQFRNALYTHLGGVYSGVMRGTEATTFFEVSISLLRRSQVYVVGEAERPGQYEVSSVSTALDALYQAGGPSANGSFRNIQIRRRDRLVATLDIYEYLTSGAASGDVILDQGDVVFVPVRGRRVEIDGNVVRPGIYELKGKEGLRALLQLAGGIEPEADLRRVQIDRVLPPESREAGVQRSLFDVNVAELMDEEGELVPLEAGDKIHVFAVTDTRRNTVSIRGNVWGPGVYAYVPGMSLQNLIDRAGGLRDDAYLGRAQIVRLDPSDGTRRILPVALSGDADPELHEYDEVVVYSVADFQEQRFVTIHGAVRQPGVYEFRDGMSLRDLVLMAGGLVDGAYTVQAEVARVPDAEARADELAELITVAIDSTYVIGDRGAAGRGGGGSSNGDTAAGAADFGLNSYDNVFVRSLPGWELQRTVTISGEVKFPGVYAMTRTDEGLRDLIARAGGLTSEAYAAGIRFFRPLPDTDAEEPAFARLNVDLEEILENGSAPDLPLADGDSIHIPEFVPTVRVEGAVLLPTSVLYKRGAGLDYYISAAGGYAADADKGRTRVERANGQVGTVDSFLFFKSKPQPGPGSRVFVPAKLVRPGRDGFDYRSLVTILTAVTTMVIVISRN